MYKSYIDLFHDTRVRGGGMTANLNPVPPIGGIMEEGKE